MSKFQGLVFIILDDKSEVSAIFCVCQDRLLRHRDREEWVASEALVDDHAEDAHHRRAAVVALGVELPGPPEDELVFADLSAVSFKNKL